ncbi:MAG: hypothetical protein IT374_25460 [Polyangiaceae bacterium]|nr:hypothetical protein [Polyangiaceae bacterium]
MKNQLIVPLFACFSLALAACGGSDDDSAPAAQPGTVNPQAAKSTATSTISGALTATKSNDGNSAVGQIQAASSSAQSIVSPAAGGGQPQALSDLGTLSLAVGPGCACEATKCVFTACKDNPSVEINGELSWEGGRVLCKNLTYKINQGGVSNVEMTTNCDLTVSDTKITGSLSSKGSTSYAAQGAGAGQYTWDATVKFNDVTHANGQPTGGSVDATSTVSVAGQTYSGSSTVKFP